MKIDGHYDSSADIAWLRVEGYDPARVVSAEVEVGLKELDPDTGAIVALEYWNASKRLPADFLELLPAPPVGVAG